MAALSLLGELPVELFVELTKYLDAFELATLAQVNRACRRRLAGAPEQARLFVRAALDPRLGWDVVAAHCPTAARPAAARLAVGAGAVRPLGQTPATELDAWSAAFRFAADCGAEGALRRLAPKTPGLPTDPSLGGRRAQNVLGRAVRDAINSALRRNDYAAAVTALTVPAMVSENPSLFGALCSERNVRLGSRQWLPIGSVWLHGFRACVRKALAREDARALETALVAARAATGTRQNRLRRFVWLSAPPWWFPTGDEASADFEALESWPRAGFGDRPGDLELLALLGSGCAKSLLPPLYRLVQKNAALPAIQFQCEGWGGAVSWRDVQPETSDDVLDYLLARGSFPMQESGCIWAYRQPESRLRIFLRHYDPRTDGCSLLQRGVSETLRCAMCQPNVWMRFRYSFCQVLLEDGRVPAPLLWASVVKVASKGAGTLGMQPATLAELLAEPGPRAVPFPALLPRGPPSLRDMFARTAAPGLLLDAVVAHPDYCVERDGRYVLEGLLAAEAGDGGDRGQGARLVENRWVSPAGMAAALRGLFRFPACFRSPEGRLQTQPFAHPGQFHLALFVVRSGLGGPGTPAGDRAALAQEAWDQLKDTLDELAGRRREGINGELIKWQRGCLRAVAAALNDLGADVGPRPDLAEST